jgi:subtilisin family serine protease
MTIGVPGNNPYVITVGAMTDLYTPEDATDDRLASFSAAGPTVEGFVKPEVVAPGGHMLGLMPMGTTLTLEHPEFHDANTYFTMSGTSQAAAVVTGVVALMLEREPFLSPDEVKCKLMSAARPAVDQNGSLAYSVFQQGAGMVNAYDATYATDLTCANRGLNVDLDLADVEHYGGRANRDESGTYYLRGLEGDGYTFTDSFVFTEGFVFSDAYVFTEGFVFTDAFMFTDGYIWSDLDSNSFVFTDAYVWSDTYVFSDGMVFTDGLTESMSVNFWVPQE